MKRLFLAVLLVTGLATFANADVVAVYNFPGGNPSQSGGTMTGTDLTAGDFDSQEIGTSGNHGFSSFDGTLFVRTRGTGSVTSQGDSLAEAIQFDSYYTFTLTNSTGSDRQMDRFEFNYWFAQGQNNGDYRVYVMSDRAGFTDGNEHGFGQTINNDRPTSGDQQNESIDISSLGVLADGASIEFRLYFVDNSTEQFSVHNVDDITVFDEAVGVPEPASAVILGIGTIGLALRRKR